MQASWLGAEASLKENKVSAPMCISWRTREGELRACQTQSKQFAMVPASLTGAD